MEYGFRGWVISLLAVFVFSNTSQAAFSFRDGSQGAPRSGLCRGLFLSGVVALGGLGYFWFTPRDQADPPPLVLEEAPDGPVIGTWRDDSKGWDALLSSGKVVELKLLDGHGKPVKLRLFDKNRAQKTMAEIARAKNAKERPQISLGTGPGFEVMLEKLLVQQNAAGELEFEVTSQLGSLQGAHPLVKEDFLKGLPKALRLKTFDLSNEGGASGTVEGGLQIALVAKENRIAVDSGKFRVLVDVPALRMKESDEAKVINARAVLLPSNKP